jgi:hypothetical protein
MMRSNGERHNAALRSLLQLGPRGLIEVAELTSRQLGMEVEQALDTLGHQLVRGHGHAPTVVQASANKKSVSLQIGTEKEMNLYLAISETRLHQNKMKIHHR